jgi:signal transduction histidine kinase
MGAPADRLARGAAWALSLAALAVAAWALDHHRTAAVAVAAVVAAAWALGAVVLAARPTGGRLSPWVAAGAVTVAGSAHGWDAALAAAPAVLTALVVVTPDGRVSSRLSGAVVGVAAAVAVGAGVVLAGASGHGRTVTLVVEWAVLAGVGALGYLARCRAASALERAQLQWLGWGVVVGATIAVASLGLDAIVGFPRHPELVAAGASVLVPFALVMGTFEAGTRVVERLLVRTIVVAGLVALVEAVYLLVVIGLGHVPTSSDRTVLASSMIAAAVAALLAVPARHRLEEAANQRVYGERHAPDEPLRTFAGRMSRAVPLDELLLQLAESLHKTLALASAEVWTGTDGVLERVASVPSRDPDRLRLTGDELAVVARAHVSGNAWIQVWIPQLLAGRDGCPVRVASVTHLGQLLGLIVVERPAGAAPFDEEDDRGLAELARPLGLALHNVRLDSALQASLDELRQRNIELRASRARIVAASDQSRRQIERNLHDGAQQHLVAMAVKIGLARRMMASDPSAADTMLEELRTDVQDTLSELRELAHGIYPPLLRDRGLLEALQTAANRATLPTTVRADGAGRYPEGVETAVYFCCLEAMQNAGKHAGEGAEVTVEVSDDVSEDEGRALCFSVRDDGAGFDAAVGGSGHGFVNMRDRLGAIGGTLEVTSALGTGTTIAGRIPLGAGPVSDGDAGNTATPGVASGDTAMPGETVAPGAAHGHTVGSVDPGHTVGSVDPGHTVGSVDPGHTVGSVDPGHTVGSVEPGHTA